MIRNRWILLVGCLSGGLGALYFGFALEWDMLNYHLYNPHALMTGRQAIDVAPAQLQSFLNPALHLPMYLVFKYMNTAVLVFIIGAIQGGQLVLLVLILEELTGQRITQRWLLPTIAVMGLIGPIFLNQLGVGQGDTILSILVLSGLLTILRELKRFNSLITIKAGMLGGLLLGMACGLKLTMALYALSLAMASFLYFGVSKRWRIIFGLAVGGILGVLLTAGAWFVYMWQVYGNPLFPYFNHVFASPWINQGNYRDMRYMPQSITEWLFYPVTWLMNPYRVWEISFQDIRIPLLIAIVFVMPLFAWRRMREKAPALGFVWLFIAFSYVLWINLFSIYRYLSVVELLAPLVIFSSFYLFVHSRRGLLALLTALIGTQVLVDYHRNPASWEFQAQTSTVLRDVPADSMIVIDGYAPVAHAALWLDDGIPLVRIRSNFMNTAESRHRLHEFARQTVRNHSGRYFLLLPKHEAGESFIADDLARVGLFLDDITACRPVFTSEELQNHYHLNLLLCPLQERGSG